MWISPGNRFDAWIPPLDMSQRSEEKVNIRKGMRRTHTRVFFNLSCQGHTHTYACFEDTLLRTHTQI